MILYSENPNLKLTKITTVRGDTEYRRNCKFINKKYYLIDRDCFLIKEKWYRYDGGNIIFNYTTQQWIHKTEIGNLIHGIVLYKNGIPTYGYFEPNPYNNVILSLSGKDRNTAMSLEILEDVFEDVALGIYFPTKNFSLFEIKKRTSIRNEVSHTDRGYNIEENDIDFNNKVNFYKGYNPNISSVNRIYSQHLGNYTFGAEIEIATGNYPIYLQNRHGIVICRDGSIDGGPELVTIPISGSKGVQTLHEISSNLQNRGDININCSLHFHIGNVPVDKLFIVAFYILCRKIQDELFLMFPYYKTDHTGVKRKNYNQKLNKLGIFSLKDKSKEAYEAYLNDSYIKIYDFLCEGHLPYSEFNKRTRRHPISRKWERHSRYYWSNLMNMFFGHRHTLEFRLHTPTTNSYKMINWLYICVAIVKFAERYAGKIITMDDKENISIERILRIYEENSPHRSGHHLSEYLIAYYNSRKKSFQEDLEKGDRISNWDMRDDKNYKFTHSFIDTQTNKKVIVNGLV